MQRRDDFLQILGDSTKYGLDLPTIKRQRGFSQSAQMSDQMVTKQSKCLNIQKDRISEMPDEILCSLLLLLPVREAVRTSILSPRWRYLSKTFLTYSSNLNLDASAMRGSDYPEKMFGSVFKASKRVLSLERSKFVRWVDHILNWDYRDVINSFRLCFFLTKDFAYHVDRWINIAISKRVQNFDMDFTLSHGAWPVVEEDLYVFPYWLFTATMGSPVRVLRLKSCILGSLDPNGFNTLLELRLHFVQIDQSSFIHFLSNCPNLEKLFLINCLELCSLEIMGPYLKLKYLTILTNTCMRYLKIGARNLIRLEYKGNLDAISFSEVCQLSEVIIHPLSSDLSTVFSDVSEKFSTRLLRLESMMLLMGPIQKPLAPSQLMNLKKLVLMVATHEGSLWGFIPLLHASPYLETLEFHWILFRYSYKDPASYILEWLQQKPSDSPYCHLKNVVLGGFTCSAHEIEFAKYILNNATCLKKVTIDQKAEGYYYKHGRHIYRSTKEPLSEDPDEERELKEGAKQQLLDVLTPGVDFLFL